MKKNPFLRVAVVLLAITMASMPVSLTNAKYVSADVEPVNEIRVFQLLPAINNTNSGENTSTEYSNCPAGYWAFFVKGRTGSAGSSTNHNGGAPGLVRGIYHKTNNGAFYVGETWGGGGRGNGGVGRPGKFITTAKASGSNFPAKDGLASIVAVAGSGGGASPNSHGGHAGASSATGAVAMQGHQNGPGSWPGHSGYASSGGIQTSNNGTSGGGGALTIGGTGGVHSGNGVTGTWFDGGDAASGGTLVNVGGGGGGLYGGGGGGRGSNSGSGGGGSSYSGAACAVPTTKHPNPTTYFQHAVNYFIDLGGGGTGTESQAILVWLGPELEAIW